LELKQWIAAHYQPVYQTGPPNVIVYRRNGLAVISESGKFLSDYFTHSGLSLVGGESQGSSSLRHKD
jgi:hypothetical protein